MQKYEVEIKSLLGSREAADALLSGLRELNPELSCVAKSSQLNHYFVGGNLSDLASQVSDILSEEQKTLLSDIAGKASEFSVRTRKKDDAVILVVKASVGNDSSANGVSRMEFEATVPLTLEELDERILASGFSYQAKWSRDREEYECKGTTVCLDRNAGYGFLAEFERVVDDVSEVPSAEAAVRELMATLGVSELPQDRLERMFTHYNQSWPEYYGTERIFIIE